METLSIPLEMVHKQWHLDDSDGNSNKNLLERHQVSDGYRILIPFSFNFGDNNLEFSIFW